MIVQSALVSRIILGLHKSCIKLRKMTSETADDGDCNSGLVLLERERQEIYKVMLFMYIDVFFFPVLSPSYHVHHFVKWICRGRLIKSAPPMCIWLGNGEAVDLIPLPLFILTECAPSVIKSLTCVNYILS